MAPRSSKSTRSTPGLPSTAFVLDNGGYSIKAGFAPSEIIPDADALKRCHTIPNAIVRSRDRKVYIGTQADEITQWSEALFRRPVENGQIVSWEAQKEIWDQSFFDDKTARKDLLVKSPENTTLIFTEPPNTMPAFQKNADEIIMEEWGFGGYSRVIGPSLNAYNDLHPLFEGELYTKPNNDPQDDLPMECLLVIDSGYSHTIVTPIFNGRPLHRAIRRLDFGGKHLTNLLKEMISVRHFDLHQDTKIVNDIKEDVCFVSADFRRDLERTWKGNSRKNKARQKPVTPPQPPPPEPQDPDSEMTMTQDAPDNPALEPDSEDLRIDYVLPDGMHLLRGFSRPHSSTSSSSLASRKRKLHSSSAAQDAQHDAEISMTLGNERFSVPEIIFSPGDIGSKQPGLGDMLLQSLGTLPPLVQATMLSNVLVVGGNARIPGFVARVQAELRMRVRSEWAVRVRSMPDPTTATWLGGARLAAGWGPTVREFGVTRDEYLEHGSAWVARRFVGGGAGKGP